MIEKLLAPLLHRTGIYRRRWDRESWSMVLCYHRVCASPNENRDRFGVERGVPLGTLQSQMCFMLEHFKPAHVHELLRPTKQNRFAVTFDDGYKDTRSLAAPLLRSLGIPATVYVCPRWVGSNRIYWWEHLGHIFRRCRALPRTLPGVPESLPRNRAAAYDRASDLLRGRRQSEIDDILDAMKLLPGIDSIPRRDVELLDWDDLAAMQRTGWAIGAHGMTHANLAAASAEEAADDIRNSFNAISSVLGRRPYSFSWPYGAYRLDTDELLHSTQAECAVSTARGVITTSSPRWRLPRIQLTRAASFAWAFQVETARRAGSG